MKKIYALLIIGSIWACSEDSAPDPQPTEPVVEHLFIKEVERNGTTFRSYTYDEEDRLSTHSYHDPQGTINFTDTYSYDGDVMTIVGRIAGEDEEYNRRELSWFNESTLRENIFFNGEMGRYILYHFTDNPCGHSSEELYDASGNLVTTKTITYLDDNCSRMEDNDDFRADFTYYLDGKNRFNKMASFIPFSPSSGNILSAESYDNFGSLRTNSFESEFEYNEEDYPILETRTYASGNIEVYKYYYY